MAAITRLGPSGHGARRASSFAGKTEATPGHPVAVITRTGSAGYGVRRAGSFAGKTSSGGGSSHPVGLITRLGSGGYGARRCGSFAGKTQDTPIIVPPDTVEVTGSGGSVAHRPVRYSVPGTRYVVPIIEHAEADEEAIIIAILTRVAELEYYQ